MTRVPLLALVGPTASGKTEASIALARALAAEILCVDSMLVYRGMDIGTAKPTSDQRARVPHHLLDVADPSEPFSVARFQRLAWEAAADIHRRGRSPLLVGGGGLYYRAVVDELEFPPLRADVRESLRSEAEMLGTRAMHQRLAAFDPDAAARIEPSNVRRTIRALEVSAVTGRRFSSFSRAWSTYRPDAVVAAGVEVARDVLRARIEQRVRRMMPGLLREAEALADRGLGGFLTSSQAIGYAEAVSCLGGAISEDEAAARTIRRTNSLARRQMAWLRRDPRIRWFRAGSDGAAGIVDSVAEYFLDGKERLRATGGNRTSATRTSATRTPAEA